MGSNVPEPEIRLQPFGRISTAARCAERFPIVARLSVYRDGSYGRAELEIGPIYVNGYDSGRFMRDITARVTFQSHPVHASGESWRKPIRSWGAVSFHGAKTSAWYAPHVSMGLRGRTWEGFDAIALIDRAWKAPAERATSARALDRLDCDLMRLIVGLRCVGVTVEIYSEHVRKAREARGARPSRAMAPIQAPRPRRKARAA